jgi:hypothetical protein
MLELREINRNYGWGNLKLFFRDKNFSKKKYHQLYYNGEFQKMKEIFIPHFERKLHVIASYLFLSKYILPLIVILLSFIITNNIISQLIFLCIGFLINYITFRILNKKWITNCQTYSFEVTATNTNLSTKYGINVDNDFDQLGEKYINGEL